MHLKSILTIVIIFSILSLPVFAARLSGKVYTFDLKKTTAVVEINTAPLQRMITEDSRYELIVPTGTFVINASGSEGSVLETVKIPDDGSFTLDLILFPDLDQESDMVDLPDSELDSLQPNTSPPWFYLLLIIILFLMFSVFLLWKHRPERVIKCSISYEDKDIEAIKAIIKAEGNRITQRDLRSKLPMTEAKVSLILTDMESRGIIRKIKKGRGNVITLH